VCFYRREKRKKDKKNQKLITIYFFFFAPPFFFFAICHTFRIAKRYLIPFFVLVIFKSYVSCVNI
jgi:hypothetical protein